MNPKRDSYIDTILYNYQNHCGFVSLNYQKNDISLFKHN